MQEGCSQTFYALQICWTESKLINQPIGKCRPVIKACQQCMITNVEIIHINKLYRISKCIKVCEESRISVKRSFLIAIKFYAMSHIRIVQLLIREALNACRSHSVGTSERSTLTLHMSSCILEDTCITSLH